MHHRLLLRQGWCLQAADFWQLGLEPLPVSAISGSGTGDMMDALIKLLPPPRQPAASTTETSSTREAIAVAILGRPNVGKSSLLNSLVRVLLPLGDAASDDNDCFMYAVSLHLSVSMFKLCAAFCISNASLS